MNRELLNVAVEEDIDNEATDQLKAAIASFGQDAEFHEVPRRGPQASLLLLGFTSVALVFGGAFVKKLGDQAAEDCYPHIKNALLGVYKKYFGRDAKYRSLIVTSSKKKSPDTKYSLILALYCVGVNNERVKFLYVTDWSHEEFEEATHEYIQSMAEFLNGNGGAVSRLISENPSCVQPYLIAWNSSEKRLVRINALPEGVNI